jgi:transcriptional regulator with XRE-family HTH domain
MTPAEFNKAMGAVIRKLRLQSGKTLKQVGEAMGCSYQQIAKNEHGVNGLSAEQVLRIAAVFGVSVAHLYEQAGHIGDPLPSAAESDGFMVSRYVSRIKDSVLRGTVVDFTRKLAYRGAEA